MMLWQHLALAVAAGMLLNFTPCVLPALPIKLRSIGRVVGNGSRARLLAGLALLAGTLTFFGGLAIATAALNWTWGALFQSRLFRIALALLLAAFGAASLAGRGIQPPQWVWRVRGNGYAEPFCVGLLAAILSTPCTGPFLGGVLAFALTQSPSIIFVLFIAVGVGLALPYLILLAVPGLIARMPASGAWLTRIQQVLGLILLAGAAFFAATALPAPITPLLWTAWAAVLTFWLLRALITGPGLAARAVPALVFLGVAAAAPAWVAGQAQSDRLDWRPLTQQSLLAAERAGLPVLIEFTADWCINCQVLEHTVYDSPRVLRAATKTDLVTLRADLTRPNDRLQRYLRRLGGAGLPYAVVLDANGQIHRKLPDLFTVEALVTAIHGAAS